MNITKKLIAASILVSAAGAALAETPYPPETPFVSTKTRADVVAEVKQAGGNLGRKNYENTFNPDVASAGKTRAEVVAELKQSDRNLARENYVNFSAH